MLYIKCTLCGHNNAVKSESTLFCEKCSKKLQNNFIDWHKHHPDKTFDDFAKIYCITDYDIAAQAPVPKKRNIAKIAGIVLGSLFILFVIFGIIGYIGVKKVLDDKLSTKTSEALLLGDWKNTKIGNSGLSLQLPFVLDKQPVNLSDTVISLIDTLESYAHVADKGFKVVTMCAKYKQGVTANLESAVQGAVSEVKSIKGITNFNWNRTDTVIGNKNGAIVTVQYQLLVYPICVKSVIVCNENCIWQVITQYSTDDQTGKKAAGKILASVDIP